MHDARASWPLISTLTFLCMDGLYLLITNASQCNGSDLSLVCVKDNYLAFSDKLLFYPAAFLQQAVPAKTDLCRLINQRWEMQDDTSLSTDERTTIKELKALLLKASV